MERKGRATFTCGYVMGLVADLKERRGCKIVLILNQGLLNEKDQNSLRTR